MSSRGGHQQDRKRRRGCDDGDGAFANVCSEGRSAAGTKLLENWAWGAMSASSIQSIAQAIVRTYDHSAKDVSALSRIGAHGHSEANCQRDLLAILGKLRSPEPVNVNIPVIKRFGHVSRTPAKENVSIFLPHDWFASVFENRLQDPVFGVGLVPDFWAGVHPDDPRLWNNPCKEIKHWKKLFIPFQHHEDGGPHSKHDSMNVTSLRSLLTTLPIEEAMLLESCIPSVCKSSKKICKEEKLEYLGDTQEALGVWFSWSWNAVFDGKHPHVDPFGQPFPPNSARSKQAGQWLDPVTCMRGMIWLAPADNQHLSMHYGMPSASAAEPCMRCPANCTDMPWHDVSKAARWRKHEYTPKYMAEHPHTTHWLLNVRGISAFTFIFDPMHCLEVGPGGTAVATVFFDASYEDFPGTKKERLKHLMVAINEAYHELGIKVSRINHLDYSHFSDIKAPHQVPPDLMHSAIKARQVRYLVPVAAHLCQRFLNPGIQYSRLKCVCLENLARFYDIVDAGGIFLEKKAALEAQTALHNFSVNYAALAKLSADAGWKKWLVRPKLHYVEHIASETKYINPKMTWCYPGESMVGSVTALAQACLSGLQPHKVPQTVCTKYRVGKHLQFDSD